MMKINLEKMHAAAVAASDLLKALANQHRMLILCRLADGEKSGGQLAEFLAILVSTVSQHLALLRRDRLVAGRRDGQMIWYRIESEPALGGAVIPAKILLPIPGRRRRAGPRRRPAGEKSRTKQSDTAIASAGIAVIGQRLGVSRIANRKSFVLVYIQKIDYMDFRNF